MVLSRRLKNRTSPPGDSDSASEEFPQLQRQDKEVYQLKQDLKDTVAANQYDRYFFTTRRFLFPFGILVGVLVGFILIQPTDLTELQTHLALLLDEYEFTMPQLPQFDISQFDLTRVEFEWQRLLSHIPEPWKLTRNGLEFTVGEEMAARGLSATHPVVLIPGIISTGLESWSTSPEYRSFFRQKLWGSFSMLSQVTFNREQWMAAIMLDPITGLDPADVKVRAAEGIDAASSFVQGYWLWSKIVENLAVVNYDTNNLHLAPYDWRLSFYNLEERDSYFSRLKTTIEGFRAREKKRVVLVAHSMGSTVRMKWVESPQHGRGGPKWVENNIEAFVSVAGTHLVKSMSAFLSGEMKDTVQIHPAGAYVLERFFSRKERQKLFRSWAGSASMWMKGGDAVWGNATFAPDDPLNHTYSHGELIAFRQSVVANNEEDLTNMTSAAASAWVLEHTPSHFQKMIATNYSFGIEKDAGALLRNNLDHRKWSNPLEVQLPDAPSTKIYCVYGHGKETEDAALIRYTRGPYEYDDIQPDAEQASCSNVSDCFSARSPLDLPLLRTSYIDAEYTDESAMPQVVNGVKVGEGDGTVNLLSLGAMCVEGWKRKRWNPSGMRVTTIELPHNPVSTIPRGGGTTGDHVDILGSTALNEIIVKVATGVGSELNDSFVSNIREYARRILWD
ncbi:phospholipid:diacylglycerol acyltransferase [Sparassis latifolia]